MTTNGKSQAGSGGNGKANGSTTEIAAEEIPYTDQGFVLYSRKWLGRELAKNPGAFVVYFHLCAWANHENGKLKRGQLALGERAFGDTIGMSVTTVRKWLRWLRDEGWITLDPVRWGAQRGTIVTILRYAESQNFGTYKLSGEEQEATLLPLPPGAPPLNEFTAAYLRVTGKRAPEIPVQ